MVNFSPPRLTTSDSNINSSLAMKCSVGRSILIRILNSSCLLFIVCLFYYGFNNTMTLKYFRICCVLHIKKSSGDENACNEVLVLLHLVVSSSSSSRPLIFKLPIKCLKHYFDLHRRGFVKSQSHCNRIN